MALNIVLNVVVNYTMTNKTLISIVGPTAIGKTSLSIALAKHFKTEIISADSRQFFKEMQIGTAAPTPYVLQEAPHHFIHHKSITDNYNVGTFETDALTKLEELYKKHHVIIMVGGSGLYVDAVTKGLDDFPKVDSTIRKSLTETFNKDGLLPLQKQLEVLDPKTYKMIAIDNPHRVMRALEICIGTGKPYSSFINKKKSNRPFQTISIGLTADRKIIYDRINQRVDNMMKDGLLDEAKSLYQHRNLNSLNTVGYKELFNYLNNEWSLEFAISEIKKNTRRFAKRQLTWFRKDETIEWFDFECKLDTIIDYIDRKLISS